jgi:phytoene dehydrogenase-like protein
VLVLDARDFVGGNTATEELTLPGWRHDPVQSAHVVIQSNPLIVRDELLLLERYGLEYTVSDPAVAFPSAGGERLVFHPDLVRTHERVARYSLADLTRPTQPGQSREIVSRAPV